MTGMSPSVTAPTLWVRAHEVEHRIAELERERDEAIDKGRQRLIDATTNGDAEIARMEAEAHELSEQLADALWQRDEARKLARMYRTVAAMDNPPELPWEEGE
jgi:hypothetical protein